MQEDEEPASPPPPPRTKQPHLAMPERSGWEYTDEDEDEDFSPPDEDSDQDSPNEHPLPDDKPNNSSLLLQHFPPERDHRSASVPTPTAEAGDIDFLPEQLQYTDIDKPPPPPTFDADTLPPPGHHFPTLPGAEFSDDEDESLSVLERIFILSKSEYREHRLSVTRALPEWLSEVDICEAAEYVLPLLNGLASDGELHPSNRHQRTFFSDCTWQRTKSRLA